MSFLPRRWSIWRARLPRERGIVRNCIGKLVEAGQLGRSKRGKLKRQGGSVSIHIQDDVTPLCGCVTHVIVSEISRYVDCRELRLVHFGVVIRIHTDFFPPEVEGESTVLNRLQFVVGLEVREEPESAVNHMRQTFLLGYLKKSRF